MKFEKLQPGMTVYSVGRTKMGNTTMSTVSVWRVRIVSVDPEGKFVMASWNTNPVRKFFRREAEKWRANKPVTIRGHFGSCRLATRAELAAMKKEQP